MTDEPRRFACVVLVDVRGFVLLQERDEHALIDPEAWGMVGGHVDEGEDVEAAAYRELAEETGIRAAAGTLAHWRTLSVHHAAYGSVDPVAVYLAGTDLTDDDVVVGEGRRIVFVDPSRIGSLPLTSSASEALPALLGSRDYRALLR